MTVLSDVTDKLNRDDNLNLKNKRVLRQCFGLVADRIDALHATPDTLTGAIAKTMATSGGDFADLSELQTYLDANTFDHADLTVTVGAGTFAHASGFTFLFDYPPHELTLTIIGVGATSILEYTETASLASFLDFRNCEVEVSTLAIDRQSATTVTDICVSADNCNVTITDVDVTDTSYGISATNDAQVHISGSSLTMHPSLFLGTYLVYLTLGARLYSGTTTYDGSNKGAGIYAIKGSDVYSTVDVITNCITGVSVVTDSHATIGSVTLTTNAADYNVTADAIQADGSFITTGSLVVGSGDLLADGTVALTADWDVGAFDVTAVDLTATGEVYAGGSLILASSATGGTKIGTAGVNAYGWRDILGPIVPKATGAGSPARTAYKGSLFDYAFGANDVADIAFHIPHDYVPGTDMYIHVHWSHNGTTISGNAVFTFALQYAKGHDQAIFGTEVAPVITYATTDIATTPQYQHRIDEVAFTAAAADATHLDRALIEVDGLILGLITLTTLPTIGGAGKLFIHTIDLHYQSNNLPTKNKAPNFYT